jgi:hypothetical protein
MLPGIVRAQRLRAAAVPVDEVIDVIEDEEEAQLAVTVGSLSHPRVMPIE